MKISNNGQIAQSISSSGYQCGDHTAFGNIIIEPTNKFVKEYKWTIKLLELTGGGYFGVLPLDCTHAVYGLALLNGDGDLWWNAIFVAPCEGCIKDDIITMVLNVKNKTLSFRRNGKDSGNIAEIDLNRKYRMSVTLYSTDSSAQLLKYEEKYDC